jgi:hypothetical protein
MSRALSIVQAYFPNVTSVADATKNLRVRVSKQDNQSAKVKNHKACAMAVATKRQEHADGVIVSMSSAYVVKGTKAVRYRLPQSVTREVVSFDRKAGFDPGDYHMASPDPSHKIGATHEGRTQTTSQQKSPKHTTGGVRAVLGSKGGEQ